MTQLHLGGGTPTFLSDDELRELMALAAPPTSRSAPGGEMLDRGRSAHRRRARGWRTWRELGFNRLSFGVQDFDPDVQQAVHRVQPFEQVRALMAQARARSASTRSTST